MHVAQLVRFTIFVKQRVVGFIVSPCILIYECYTQTNALSI